MVWRVVVVVEGVSSNESGEMGVVGDIKEGRSIVDWVGEGGVVACVSYGVSPNRTIAGDSCRDVCCVLGDIGGCWGKCIEDDFS